MDVSLPDGQEVEIQMHDDGLHFDGQPNDGIWGGQIDATEVGVYSVQAILTGQDNNGRKFIRSTQHLIPVVPNEVELTGNAVAEKKDNSRLFIHLGVTSTSTMQPVDALFRAYAEVWGTDSSNNDVPACWIESLVYMDEQQDGSYIVTLELDTNWLKRAGVTAPLTLRNVYISDATVHVPVTEMTEIPVTMTNQASKLLMAIPAKKMNIPITKEMRQGVRPSRAHVNRTEAAPTLMMVHGYCADSNPFNKFGDFTNAAFFLEKMATRDNNKFSELVAEYANTLGMTSFGIIGHSQGGTVSLHLLNYFFTGLDEATGSRVIQSVGTPWKGCSAAGSAANLGKAFGVGCGANPDLTTDGANLWLSGIDTENFKSVYYYTTSYEQGNFFGDYCNLAVNLVLQWPNDGVTEIKYAKLTGGNNMGNKEKWCHTTDMTYPAQYLDRPRNAEMNSLAAR